MGGAAGTGGSAGTGGAAGTGGTADAAPDVVIDAAPDVVDAALDAVEAASCTVICDPLTTCSVVDGASVCSPCPPGYAGTGETSCVELSPTLTILASDPVAAEGGGDNGEFTISRGAAVARSLTVNLSIESSSTMTSTAGLLPVDYRLSAPLGFRQTGTTINVDFPPGESTLTIALAGELDDQAEADEALTLKLVAGTGYAVGAADTASVTIARNGTRVTRAGDSLGDYAVLEGSLRQAIANAQVAGAPSLVVIDSGLDVTTVGEMPLLTLPTTIRGTTGVVLRCGVAGQRFIENRAASTIEQVEITACNGASPGSAILNRGDLTLRSVRISSSSSTRGVITQFLPSGTPNLSISGCTFQGCAGGSGVIENSNGTMTITSTQFLSSTGPNVAGAYTNGGGNTPPNP
jgi:hypothetical protein